MTVTVLGSYSPKEKTFKVCICVTSQKDDKEHCDFSLEMSEEAFKKFKSGVDAIALCKEASDQGPKSGP